ncbi:MAG TPA: hypothetical protein VF179_20745 [Thermoanaerobaculia bacterium]|nr:hypothetical protein [Thermoanaerobaculia bacterium]
MTIDDEVRRAAKLLEALIQATGVSSEEMEKRLDASPGYVRRLLSGALELKLRHILAILRVLEIEPALFFQTLYPEAGPAGGTVRLDELRQRLTALGVGCEPTAPKPEVGMDDLEKLVQSAVQAALSRRKAED